MSDFAQDSEQTRGTAFGRWTARLGVLCAAALAVGLILHGRQTSLKPGPPPRSGAPAIHSATHVEQAPAERTGPYAVSVRLVDLLDEAVYYAPDSTRAEQALTTHWRRLASPYVGPGGVRGRIVQDVAMQRGEAHKPQPWHLGGGKTWTPEERIWNMTEGSFEQRECIFAPAPSSIRYHLTLPPHAIFEAAPLVLASKVRVTFDVSIVPGTGKREVLDTRTVDAHEARWRDWRIDLSRFGGQNVQLELTTRAAGATGVPAFWGTPVVLSPGASPIPFNVVFIVVDAMRGDAVARSHEDAVDEKIRAAKYAPLEAALPKMEGLTPSLDALASAGVIFSQARSAATWTRPGTIAMLTGALSTSLGMNTTDILPNINEVRRFYTSRPPLLPLLLRPYGVVTRAFVNNFYMFGYGTAGVDMGFEGLVDHRHETLDTDRITTDAVAWLRENRDRRFAIFVNYNSPHRPYVPPPADLAAVPKSDDAPKDSTVRHYLGEIHKDDAAIGVLLKELDALGLTDDTVVISTADHGEPLSSDHDGVPVDIWRGEAPPGRFHHMLTAWDETARVPLIFRYPRKVPRGVVSQAPASTIDIVPTLLDLAGVGIPARMDGRSLVDAMNGKSLVRPLVTEARGARVILDGRYRLIVRSHNAHRVRMMGGLKIVDHQLYDLDTDPGERAEISAQHPDIVARLGHELEALTKKPPASRQVSMGPSNGHPIIRLRFAGAGVSHRVTGHVTTGTTPAATKFAVTSVQLPQSVVQKNAEGSDLEFATSPNGVVGFDIDVEPPTASVVWQFSIDGKPWPAERIYAGTFGLRAVALETGIKDEAGRLFAAAEVPPFIDAKSDFGLFVTRDSVLHELELDQSAATEETMNLMQAWGYASDHPDGGPETPRE